MEWSFVNFNQDTITIENNIPYTKKGQAIEKGPKSLASYRDVDMPMWYMEELALYEAEWYREKDFLGDQWEGGDRQFVFHNGKGKPYYYQHATKWWKRFCERHSIRYIKFHGLRHSSGTLLLEDEDESNFDAILMAIQRRLGHARLSTTTDIYVHVTKKVKKRTAGKFDKFARK
ncbi:site-specific tyrosine recombinase XerC [compost metagenome]